MVACPGAPTTPPSGIYVCQQDALDPCKWIYNDVNFNLGVSTEVNEGIWAVGPPPGYLPKYFIDEGPFDCAVTVETNDRNCADPNVEASGGTAEITW